MRGAGAEGRTRRPMGFAPFKASLAESAPPLGLALPLQALWYAAKGDWDRAHGLAQTHDDEGGAWVHAYLHRREGDADNARYWYRRAGRPFSTAPHAKEWVEIARALLKANEGSP